MCMEIEMKTLVIGLAASAILAVGAAAQSQGTSTSQAPAAQSQTTNSSPSAATTATPSNGVNVRANIRTGSGRTLIRERSEGPSVVYSRTRTRHVTAVDERPSRITVIKKKKYAKNKKRTRIYANAPSRNA